jgi:plasmid stabilization system protein ParE
VRRYRVIISPTVQQQITARVLYIAKDSVDNALAWEDRRRSAVEAIGDMPGHAVDEDANDRLGYAVRKYVFERTYLVHYRVDETDGVVRIVNFRHGARLSGRDEP